MCSLLVLIFFALAALPSNVSFGKRYHCVTPNCFPATNEQTTESFETARAGEFEVLKSSLGVWRVEAGRAKVDNQHAKSGQRCLQLLGGKRTTVTLDISGKLDAPGEMQFWAERWTRRSPFSFRIEKETDQGW